MRTNREEAARMLAEDHYKASESIRAIYRLLAQDENRKDEPIKLLEVNNETIPVGIEPLYFQPDPATGVLFSVVLVELTPEEFRDPATRRKLSKEFGWTVSREALKRPLVAKAT